MFVGLGLSSVIPIIHALRIYGYQGLEDRISVSWVAAQGGFYIFGAALYAVCTIF
jgi:adiponectin receptor